MKKVFDVTHKKMFVRNKNFFLRSTVLHFRSYFFDQSILNEFPHIPVFLTI